jgi:two-component system chemotaxis response regulator CheB
MEMSAGNHEPEGAAGTDPWLVVLAASADGIQAIQTVLSGLPPGFQAAVIVVQHRSPERPSQLEHVLSRYAAMPVVTATENEEVRPGLVYIARPDSHLTIDRNRTFAYHDGKRIRFLRSSANPLLESAAAAFGGQVVAVVLTGTGSDATDGVQCVKGHGGIVLAQDRSTSGYWGMPGSAVASGSVDLVLPLHEISAALKSIVDGVPVPGLKRTDAAT